MAVVQLILDTEALKALRLAGGYTQKALAARAGISALSYNFIEQGKQHPRISTINKLAAALDIPLAKIATVEKAAS